jgi:hypothetical protein
MVLLEAITLEIHAVFNNVCVLWWVVQMHDYLHENILVVILMIDASCEHEGIHLFGEQRL